MTDKTDFPAGTGDRDLWELVANIFQESQAVLQKISTGDAGPEAARTLALKIGLGRELLQRRKSLAVAMAAVADAKNTARECSAAVAEATSVLWGRGIDQDMPENKNKGIPNDE